MALTDRDAIMVYVAQDNPIAAIELDIEFESKAENARLRPTLYKPGRRKGTRAIVVRPNYVMVYRVIGDVVEVLRRTSRCLRRTLASTRQRARRLEPKAKSNNLNGRPQSRHRSRSEARCERVHI